MTDTDNDKADRAGRVDPLVRLVYHRVDPLRRIGIVAKRFWWLGNYKLQVRMADGTFNTDFEYEFIDVRNDAPTMQQVESACLSYQHDYGLLSDDERSRLRFEAIEWLTAWRKERVL